MAAAESRASVAVAEPDSGSGSGSSGVSSSSPSSFDASFLEDFGETAAEYLELFPDDRAPLVSLAKELFARYFAAAKRAHAFDGDDGPPPPPPETLARSLASMTEKIEAIHRACPEVGLGDRAAEVVERAIRGRVDAAFIALEAKLRARSTTTTTTGRREKTCGARRWRRRLAKRPAVHSPAIRGVGDALLTGVVRSADVRAVLEERPAMVAAGARNSNAPFARAGRDGARRVRRTTRRGRRGNRRVTTRGRTRKRPGGNVSALLVIGSSSSSDAGSITRARGSPRFSRRTAPRTSRAPWTLTKRHGRRSGEEPEVRSTPSGVRFDPRRRRRRWRPRPVAGSGDWRR